MFIHATPDDGLIPHHENIIKVHGQNPLTTQLDTLNAIYAGGYAMALLFAPRVKNFSTRMEDGYYGDYDLYAKDPEDLERLIAAAKAMFIPEHPLAASPHIVETDKAISFQIEHEEGHQNVQIIKFHTGSPEEILARYDFVNCAVTYDPSNHMISMHKDTLVAHLNETLEILNPWMLNEISEETKRNVIIQLIRFKKYCYRWNYTIGERAFDLLMEIYTRYPEIRIEKDVRYGTGSGEEIPIFGKRNQNVWEAMACLFKQYSDWSDDLDTIGHINRGSDEFLVNDQFFAEVENTIIDTDDLVAAAFGTYGRGRATPRHVDDTGIFIDVEAETDTFRERIFSSLSVDPEFVSTDTVRQSERSAVSSRHHQRFMREYSSGITTPPERRPFFNTNWRDFLSPPMGNSITVSDNIELIPVYIREEVQEYPNRAETVNSWQGTIPQRILLNIQHELERSGVEPGLVTVQHHEGGAVGLGYITRYPILMTMMQRMGLVAHESSPETHGE